MEPAFKDDWAKVYAVDALTGASLLPEKSVHCIVTSPPYWGLRSYLPSDHPDKAMELGAEKTPEEYVEKLVEVFRALRRVLRDDGTLWLNLGDSYNNFRSSAYPAQSVHNGEVRGKRTQGDRGVASLKEKDLVGIPWMIAFALRSDGWYLRSDIIWSKPNPMPESVTDRPTKSHEYMFLLTKSPRYYFDQEAVREQHANGLRTDGPGHSFKPGYSGNPNTHGGKGHTLPSNPAGRNIRSVWNIATKPYPGSHYAVFPPDLIYPCIKAGTSERGVCGECGAPWERVVGEAYQTDGRGSGNGFKREHRLSVGGRGDETPWVPKGRDTVGWQPTCSCTAETIPATVLDPFMGSGTTALASRNLGRRSIGFDLDERNIKQVEERLGLQGVMF